MPDVSPPPADGERVPPLTAQQLGLCGPRSDDPGVGQDAACHTPPADDQAARRDPRWIAGFDEGHAAGADAFEAILFELERAANRRDVLSGLLRGMARRASAMRVIGASGIDVTSRRWAKLHQRTVNQRNEAQARLAAVRVLAEDLDPEREMHIADAIHEALDGPADPGLSPAPNARQTLDVPAEAPAPEPTEPWKAPEFFADAMRDHGRCWCSVDGPCIPGKSCDLCDSLPADWPCPTIDHAGYPLPAMAAGPAEAAEPTPDEKCTPAEEAHDEMCPGCDTCLWPDRTAAEAGAPEPAPEHVVETWVSDRTPRDYGWQCFTCGDDNGGFDSFHTAEQSGIRHAAKAGSVTTTPAAPGYPRIADAITAACEAADIDLTVVHDGRVLDYAPGVVWLATVLDKSGLIDWTAFADETGSDTSAAADPAALALIDDLLRPWAYGYPVNPGYAGRAAQYVSVETLAGWNARRAALASATGPRVEPALIGTWADPEFQAHADHKHAVDGCGYCPEEEDR